MNNIPCANGRRQFLRQACCAGVAATGTLSTIAQLRAIGAIAADKTIRSAALPGDYKALICLFLNGGNDGNSIVLPNDTSAYADYSATRGTLAVARGRILPLNPRTYSDGRAYGLHPALKPVHDLFVQGKAAILSNVGTLVRPTTLVEYKAGKALPLQLYSHNDQATQWQSSLPDRPFETGWGGRLADFSSILNENPRISMSMSLSGTNRFQIGNVITQLAVNPSGAVVLTGYNPGTGRGDFRYDAVKAMMATPQANALAQALANTGRLALADGETLSSTLRSAAVLKTSFPATDTGRRLSMVAKLISVAPSLGLRRQIFFVQLGGFDLHGGQADGHEPLLIELADAISSLYSATVELGVAEQVTTFTGSDFGRTYVPNSGGTDHGWGNQHFIIGGAVKGGDIYGTMPSLAVNGPDDTGRGRWIPTTSVDEYNATLATWFGVSQTDLSTVLPNIGRFARPNLGFMG